MEAQYNISRSNSVFDVAVVGGGVVGCAVARRFTLEGAHVALLEKASDILDGASKGNSAILHTGFDAPEGSLELQCLRAGYAEYHEICAPLGLALEETGAHVVAWSPEERGRWEEPRRGGARGASRQSGNEYAGAAAGTPGVPRSTVLIHSRHAQAPHPAQPPGRPRRRSLIMAGRRA